MLKIFSAAHPLKLIQIIGIVLQNTHEFKFREEISKFSKRYFY